MGTMASIHVHDAADEVLVNRAIDEVLAELDRLEAMFTTYRPESEISKVNRGELHLGDCRREVAEVLDACTWLEQVSNGAFDIRPDGPGGRIDPAGFVKGWATERAATALRRAGLEHWYVSVGGDMVVSGEAEHGVRWRIGIADPLKPGEVLATLDVAAGGVATSGTAERGGHVWDARDGSRATQLASVTVMGPSLTWADAFATTVFVMGEPGLAWLASFDNYYAVAVRPDGSLVASDALT
jgi:thiamine biosynthesis lipoprotein